MPGVRSRAPHPNKFSDPSKAASGSTDEEPRQLADIEQQHPGFRFAYQTATLKEAGKVIAHCVQLVLQRDAGESAVREYEMVETYRMDDKGSMVLEDVNITPESAEDFPEFYECIASTRKNARISIPTSPDMKMGAVIRVYDGGRIGTGPLTQEGVAEVVVETTQQIAEMEKDDPYRPFIQNTLDLFRCYQNHGVDTANRLRCLRFLAGDERHPE